MARWLPLTGVVVFLGVMGWRLWLHRRRHGSAGVFLFRSEQWTQRVRDAFGVVLVVGVVAQAIAAAASAASIGEVAFVGGDALTAAQVIGALLMVGGLVLLVIGQLDLGGSWRIGIDEAARPGLVTAGLYRFSRNPIFLAILVMLVGYTLLLPTRLSLVLLLGALVGIRQQVLAEEAYLARTYGGAYREYARRVGRFLPGIGRLAAR